MVTAVPKGYGYLAPLPSCPAQRVDRMNVTLEAMTVFSAYLENVVRGSALANSQTFVPSSYTCQVCWDDLMIVAHSSDAVT